jgi:hypothetical protein
MTGEAARARARPAAVRAIPGICNRLLRLFGASHLCGYPYEVKHYCDANPIPVRCGWVPFWFYCETKADVEIGAYVKLLNF